MVTLPSHKTMSAGSPRRRSADSSSTTSPLTRSSSKCPASARGRPRAASRAASRRLHWQRKLWISQASRCRYGTVQHITHYLSSHGAVLAVLDLSFTGLSEEVLHLLLPSLWALPRLTQLLLNGNRLTWATARKLTDAIKDTTKFPALAWVDLGNNVDVASLPQPLLVGLCPRLSQRTSLPTIYEGLELESEGGAARTTTLASTWDSTAAGLGPEPQVCCAR
ncbi:hypothetical protein H8959_007367 [Pygathrix nigripes]